MNTNQLRVAGAGVAFIIMFFSGFWLNRTGKPYGTFIFGIHKLVGVGTGVLLFITLKQIHQAEHLNSVEIFVVVIAALFFFATVTTGSLLSVPVSKPMPEIVTTLNKIFPYMTVISTAAALFVLLSRN